ncbi:MAG: sigma-70 family RNA polymerase sigma factor [Melioribacteraceae bacterium]|nr:sigma-70 family RNA polymerase sigma factor [Melioribacteraceae bacterium]
MGKYSELTDLEVLKKVYQKDPRALEELYDRYSPLLYSLLKKISPDEKTAEIILVEVFVIIWEKTKLFDFKNGNVYTWLVYLTRNRAIDSIKRSRASSEAIDNYDEKYENFFIIPKLDEKIDSLDLSTAFNIKSKMEKALEALTDEHKYIIHTSFYEGYTLNEIAQKMNLPVESVREKVTSAAHRLKDNLIGT